MKGRRGRITSHALAGRAAALALVLLGAATSEAFYCGGALIERGDSMDRVVDHCGKPAWITEWQEEIIYEVDDVFERSREVTIEEWVYNFGPNNFMWVLRFARDTVETMESVGRGFVGSPPARSHCTEHQVREGDLKLMVLHNCGEPTARKDWTEKITVQTSAYQKRRVWIRFERWTYDNGPTAQPRYVLLRNDRVTRIGTAEIAR